MPPVADAAAHPAERADIRGLVDNATDKGLYGWVWNARRPGERLVVELQLDGRTLTSAVADGARPDLARAGVGDGAHAFALRLLPEWQARRDDVTVLARAADGTQVTIPQRAPKGGNAAPMAAPDSVSPAAAQLLQGLGALAASQRQMQDALDGIAARLPERADAELLVTAQRDLADRLDALEQWLTRLDTHLADGAAPPAQAPGHARLALQAALFATLSLAGLGALGFAAFGLGG
jgi:hypothetical protein